LGEEAELETHEQGETEAPVRSLKGRVDDDDRGSKRTQTGEVLRVVLDLMKAGWRVHESRGSVR
jgi:hypothetical protein